MQEKGLEWYTTRKNRHSHPEKQSGDFETKSHSADLRISQEKAEEISQTAAILVLAMSDFSTEISRSQEKIRQKPPFLERNLWKKRPRSKDDRAHSEKVPKKRLECRCKDFYT